jgi:hypothetical protein
MTFSLPSLPVKKRIWVGVFLLLVAGMLRVAQAQFYRVKVGPPLP